MAIEGQSLGQYLTHSNYQSEQNTPKKMSGIPPRSPKKSAPNARPHLPS